MPDFLSISLKGDSIGVLVYGEIGYSKTGEPTTIRVERFESLRTTDVLPQAGEVRGIYADSPISASDHADFLREH